MPDILKKVQHSLSENSPAILTGLALTGLVTTTVLAVRATPRATRDIWDAESELIDPLTNLDKVKLTWKHYIPAGISAVSTAACMLSVNSVHSRRNAALMSLYSLSETAFKEYKDKVVEKIGENKEREVHDEVAQDRVTKNPPEQSIIVHTGDKRGQILCYDSVSGRYFRSSVETIRQAQNDINAQCINEVYASQNDFYRLINLPINGMGEEVGWSTDNMLDIRFTSTLTEDQEPAIVLDYRRQPIHGYHKMH